MAITGKVNVSVLVCLDFWKNTLFVFGKAPEYVMCFIDIVRTGTHSI